MQPSSFKTTNNMKEQLVSYELAIMLKEAGFNGECREYYVFFPDSYPNPNDLRLWCVEMPCDHNSEKHQKWAMSSKVCSAPTLSLAVKWLREEKKICVEARVSNEPNAYLNDMDAIYFTTIITLSGSEVQCAHWNKDLYESEPKWFDSYEEALTKGISEALNLILKK